LMIKKEKGVAFVAGHTAGSITALLAQRHVKDVFVPECKNGETWGVRDLLIIDAWVLVRSYSPLTTIGYEIKCSRQDFEQDQKWVGYLDLCHLFNFVCPAGLIRSTDIPDRVGLIWVSQSGHLHWKKRPQRVEPNIEKLNRLLTYVVMARSQIVANMYDRDKEPVKDRLESLRETVQRAQDSKDLAYFIKGHIREVKHQQDARDGELRQRENNVKRFQEHLAQLGITWDAKKNAWQDTNRVELEIAALKQRLDSYTLENMARAGKQLTDVVETIRKMRLEG
jgi:hypothetical protein